MVPPCRALGRQCQELTLTLRIADVTDDGPQFQDAIATWLTGHTERIRFGDIYRKGDWILVDARVAVPCRYLSFGGNGTEPRARGAAECGAHGFRGALPPARRVTRPPLQHGNGSFTLVDQRKRRRLRLPAAPAPRRSLPVMAGPNPCAGARCRTADNREGAACCRDLTLEVVAPPGETMIEALLRSRRAPYLCKVSRAEPAILECEVISACGYLESDGVACVLHGRVRPDGEPAKPSVCSDWPDLGPDDTGHPGCRLVKR